MNALAHIHPLTYCTHHAGESVCGLTSWGFWSILLIAAAVTIVIAMLLHNSDADKELSLRSDYYAARIRELSEQEKAREEARWSHLANRETQ